MALSANGARRNMKACIWHVAVAEAYLNRHGGAITSAYVASIS